MLIEASGCILYHLFQFTNIQYCMLKVHVKVIDNQYGALMTTFNYLTYQFSISSGSFFFACSNNGIYEFTFRNYPSHIWSIDLSCMTFKCHLPDWFLGKRQQKFQRILKLNTKSRLLLWSNKTNINFHYIDLDTSMQVYIKAGLIVEQALY